MSRDRPPRPRRRSRAHRTEANQAGFRSPGRARAGINLRSGRTAMVDYFSVRPYAVAVVGAGSGIGRAAAALLGGQGVAVACLDRDLGAAEETARAIAAV